MAQDFGLFLVLSNLALIPAVIYCLAKKKWVLCIIFSRLLLVSTFYHICQAGYYCFSVTLEALRTSDHFFVYMSLTWLVLYLLGLPIVLKLIVSIVVEMIALPALVAYIDSWWVLGTILIMLAAVILITMAIRFAKSPARLKKLMRIDILDTIMAVTLISLGFVFHILAGEPGSYRYGWAHALWHVFAMLGMFFVLEMKDGKDLINKILTPSSNKSGGGGEAPTTSASSPDQEIYIMVEDDDDNIEAATSEQSDEEGESIRLNNNSSSRNKKGGSRSTSKKHWIPPQPPSKKRVAAAASSSQDDSSSGGSS